MRVLADASIPHVQDLFKQPFILTLYQRDSDVPDLLAGQDILICRSTLKVNEALLKQGRLRCVATASSGTDHLDVNYLKAHHIDLFDAKGSNAKAVADYVMASVAYLAGQQRLKPCKAGVVGVGFVGSAVALRLQAAGFDVCCYDPIRSAVSDFVSCDFDEILSCDLICIHANLHDTPPFPSRNLFNFDNLSLLKPQTVIINAARGGIVNESDLLRVKNPMIYCTDVYSHEPAISPEIVAFATLCTPHIAGHTIEAKVNAAMLVSQAIHQRFGIQSPSVEAFIKPSKSQQTPTLNAMLAHYNPWFETQLLKASTDLQHDFVKFRKNHRYRHDY